jgi:hypothetical protein
VALKNICLLPHGCDLEFLRLHTCDDGSHAHISSRQLRKYESDKVVELIAQFPRPVAVRLSCYRGGTKIAPRPQLRDRSCGLGDYHVTAIVLATNARRRGFPDPKVEWALVMYADIRRTHGLLPMDPTAEKQTI